MNNNGWIKLHRSLLEWEWYQDHNVVIVFLHCLLRANHKDKKWQGIIIQKGSFITSYQNMSKELSGKNGSLSVQQVRTALNKLKSTNEITIKTSNKYTCISINNWSEYQDDNTQDNKQITNKQQTNNKQITTNKNDKNIKNIKNISNTSPLKGKRLPKDDELTQTDFEEIAGTYKVPLAFVLSKWEDVLNYCHSNNKKYANFKRVLSAWVKKDAIKIRKDFNDKRESKSSIAFFNEEA